MVSGGCGRMGRRDELTLLATADLEFAAGAWSASATARDLYRQRDPAGSVDVPRFEHLSRWLADDLDRAVHAFRRSDETLRRELADDRDRFGLADPARLVAAVSSVRELGIAPEPAAQLLRQIGGADDAARLDRHGAEWLLRFFALLGHSCDAEERRTGPGRPASAAQLSALRTMFLAYEGEEDEEDRRLTGWIAGRYGVPALGRLDAATAWKALVRLREHLSAPGLEAAA